MRLLLAGPILLGLLFLDVGSIFSEVSVESDPCKVLVPIDRLSNIRAMKNPIPWSEDVIAEGKVIYVGKGTCFVCHGVSGKGDGDAGRTLDPAPRDLTNPAFQDCKTDGEIFHVIRFGLDPERLAPVPKHHFRPPFLTEGEIWKVAHYLRTLRSESEEDNSLPGHRVTGSGEGLVTREIGNG